MKNLFVLLLFTISQLISAQEIYEVKETRVKIQTLKIECESAKELANVNWTDIKEIIESNEPNDIVSLEFGYPKALMSKDKVKSSFNFKIKGKSKDVLNIIKRAKKGVKAISNIASKIK